VSTAIENGGMNKEVKLLNLICVIAAIVFVALAVLNAIFSGDFFTTDNLFVTMVCMVMALVFAINPLFYLQSEGKLPIPFIRRSSPDTGQIARASTPQLLDAKGRPVPPDVRAMVISMSQTRPKDV
jgi:hypothetical protein